MNGVERSLNGRGFNIVSLSGKDGKLLKSDVFDTFRTPEESRKMTQFIKEIPQNAVILVAICDDAGYNLIQEGKKALFSVGATVDASSYRDSASQKFRMSFAMVTRKSRQKPSWFSEKYAYRGKGPVKIKKTVFFDI